MDYFHVCTTVISFINLFHVYITFVNHIYLTFYPLQAEDNYPMFYWTINSYRIISEVDGELAYFLCSTLHYMARRCTKFVKLKACHRKTTVAPRYYADSDITRSVVDPDFMPPG